MSRRAWIALVVTAVLLSAAAVAVLLWPRAAPGPAPGPVPTPVPEAPPEPPRLDLAPVTFVDLPGWEDDDPSAALPAFLRSCAALAPQPDDRPVGPHGVGGTVADWRPACRAALTLEGAPAPPVRAFFESHFTPWATADRGDPEGLFTGYYEPTLHGSRRRGGPYRVPLYTRPPELVEVDLGAFRADLAGRRIAGVVAGRRLVPMPDRRGIDGGALTGRGLELVWVDDAVDAFFLHVQGSGRVVLDDGGEMRVGYAAQNGHPYRAIGRELVERGDLALAEVSLQSIRAWLAAHPDEAAEVMAANPSYVFFRRLDGEGPVGSQGVVLTPGRSLAVDTVFHPLGAPVWLAAAAPAPAAAPGGAPAPAPGPDAAVPLRRLLVAQDTGGAIRGPVRGDVFWGPGDQAESIAGRMKHPGRMWLLLPRAVEPPASSGPPATPGTAPD